MAHGGIQDCTVIVTGDFLDVRSASGPLQTSDLVLYLFEFFRRLQVMLVRAVHNHKSMSVR